MRKLIKDLETKTKAVEAEASLIMEKKDKRIIELKESIKEYEEKLSNKNKHITELEEKLGGGGSEYVSCWQCKSHTFVDDLKSVSISPLHIWIKGGASFH